MFKLINKNRIFLIVYVLILSAGLIPVLLYPKADIHLFINKFHSPFFDALFRYSTHLGSGFVTAAVVVVLLFINIRYSFILASSAITSGILVQFLKHRVFPGLDRPVAFFDNIAELYVIQGVDMHTHFSFPSGYSATAFITFGILALISERVWIKNIVLLVAVIASFSRVYLSQHFLGDILGGSVLGMLVLMFFYWYFQTLKMVWMNQPVHNFFRSDKP